MTKYKKNIYLSLFGLGMFIFGGFSSYFWIDLNLESVYPNTVEEDVLLSSVQPNSCIESSANNQSTCKALINGSTSGWTVDGNVCEGSFVEYSFNKPVFIEFLIIEEFYDSVNLEIKEILITVNESEQYYFELLDSDEFGEWIDLQSEVTKIKIEISKLYKNQSLENDCGLTGLQFYGYKLGT